MLPGLADRLEKELKLLKPNLKEISITAESQR